MTMKKVLVISVLLLAAARVMAQGSDPLAELAALGNAVAETQPEAGGSIRAKKEGDVGRSQRINDPKTVEAKVDEVSTKAFPVVALRLKVQKPAKDGAGKDLKANDTVVVVPKLKAAGSGFDLKDASTTLNAGAYYLQQGDKVAVRLGEKKGSYYEAEYIERK
jgi:hypothetical protein